MSAPSPRYSAFTAEMHAALTSAAKASVVRGRPLASTDLLRVILAPPENAVTAAVGALGVEAARVREALVDDDEPLDADGILTQRVAGALRRAESIANERGSLKVGTGHFLAALLEVPESALSRALDASGVDAARLGTEGIALGDPAPAVLKCAGCGLQSDDAGVVWSAFDSFTGVTDTRCARCREREASLRAVSWDVLLFGALLVGVIVCAVNPRAPYGWLLINLGMLRVCDLFSRSCMSAATYSRRACAGGMCWPWCSERAATIGGRVVGGVPVVLKRRWTTAVTLSFPLTTKAYKLKAAVIMMAGPAVNLALAAIPILAYGGVGLGRMCYFVHQGVIVAPTIVLVNVFLVLRNLAPAAVDGPTGPLARMARSWSRCCSNPCRAPIASGPASRWPVTAWG